MDAKEFRIGNLLGYLEVDLDNGGEVIKNHPCTLNDIAEIERGNVYNRYSEIPLTDDLLMDFGLEKNKYFYHFDIGNLQITPNGNSYWNGAWVRTPKYAHQLQNLYKELSGVELQIK